MLPAMVRGMLERAAADYLRERCRIERRLRPTDALGAMSTAYAMGNEDVPCRVIQMGRSNKDAIEEAAGMQTAAEAYIVALPRGAQASIGDHVVLTSGVRLEIVRTERLLTDALFQRVWAVDR